MMRLSPVIRTCFRSSRAQPLRTGLLVFGIALGVAGIVAIDIARTSVSKSFELSAASLTARSTHQVLGSDFTLPQSLFVRLRTQAGIHNSAPVISRLVGVRELGDRSLTLLGLDLFSEGPFRSLGLRAQEGLDPEGQEALHQVLVRGRGVMLSRSVAGNLAPGDPLTLVLGRNTVSTQVGAVVDSGDPALDGLVMADISLAQELLDLGTRISRIDLRLETPEEIDRVRDLLEPGQVLVETAQRNAIIRGLSRSFEASLSAFSVLVLFMGIFLVYNTVSFSVARRQRLTGTFRALGATRRDVFLSVMAEVMAYALAGSALGLVLGILLGQGAVQAVCATVSEMYYTLTVSQTHIAPATLAKGLAVGLGAALASSLAPAVNAARTLPVTLMQTSSSESRLNRFLPALSAVGLLMLAGAPLLFSLDRHHPAGGGMPLVFAGVFMIFGGASLLAPALILGLTRILTRILERGVDRLGQSGGTGTWAAMACMGIRNVRRSLSRTSVLIASLMVVISVYIGIDTMTHSFRQSLISWVDGHIGGDVHVGSTDDLHLALAPDLYTRVRSMAEVTAVSAYNIHKSLSQRSGEVHLFSYLTDTSTKEWTWLDPAARNRTGIPLLLDRGWILASEIFARQNGLDPDQAGGGGLLVTMDTLAGPREFRVAGIFRDFFMGGGRAVVSRQAMKQFWGKDEITAMQVFLDPGIRDRGAAIAGVMARIRAASKDPAQLRLRSGPEIKRGILKVFDNTFLITTALQFLTALVALTGIVNSVMALILERSRELGILRACGAEPAQVRTLVLWECALSGFMAGLLSLPLGLVLSWVLVDVVNFRAFGWTYDLRLSPVTPLLALGFSTLAALASGMVPAHGAGRVPVAEALRTE